MGSEYMCVGFIFWDVEINNDFEDITTRKITDIDFRAYIVSLYQIKIRRRQLLGNCHRIIQP
jgi:hypothetical protein